MNLFSFSLLAIFIGSAYALAGYLARKIDSLPKPKDAEAERPDPIADGELLKRVGSARDIVLTIIGIALFMTVMLFVMCKLEKFSVGRMLFTVASFLFVQRLMKHLLTGFNLNGWVELALRLSAAVVVTMGWMRWPGIVTYMTLGWSLTVAGLIEMRIMHPKATLILYAGLCVYDVIAVFGTGMMMEVDKRNSYPASISFPQSYAEWTNQPSLNKPASNISMLEIGLGDIIIPGLLIMAAVREHRKHDAPAIIIGSSIGWLAGLAISGIVINVFPDSPQPATIYLLPATTAGFVIGACLHKKLRLVFETRI